MSIIQHSAGRRWLFLCLLNGGEADFIEARHYIPRHFLLSEQDREVSKSRPDEPHWLIAMRNFMRDVGKGKHQYFTKTKQGLRLTPEAQALIGSILDEG
jgi:hypothetical protein